MILVTAIESRFLLTIAVIRIGAEPACYGGNKGAGGNRCGE